MFVLALSLGFNVYLARKAGLGAHSSFAELKVNSKLPSPLPLLDGDGKPVSLTFDDSRPTVIYVLSPLCGWCKKNEANIKALTAAAGSHFKLIGLSTEPTNLKQYIAEGHAPFPVYQVSSKAQMEKLGLGGTPETIVVGPGAKVEKAWRGAYMAENVKEIENFFGVKLPGLQEPVTASN
jgi:hypothetical protein